jgi:mannose-6-phosphate isomerase-like protein (cupin superfamily)
MGRLVRLAEVPEKKIPSGRWQQLNERLGIRAFGVNAVAMDPDDEFDIEHDEGADGAQEMYVVVSGRAGFRLGDEEVEAGPGDVVAVPDPGETRDYWALEPGTRIVCIGATPVKDHPYGEWIDREAQGG